MQILIIVLIIIIVFLLYTLNEIRLREKQTNIQLERISKFIDVIESRDFILQEVKRAIKTDKMHKVDSNLSK